jgi:hypothetical protein
MVGGADTGPAGHLAGEVEVVDRRGVVSHHIARMTRRSLVTKEKCDSDRRGAHVVVTDRGRTEIEAAAPGHVAAVRPLFVDQLTRRQLEALGDAARTVLAAFDDRPDPDAAPSMPAAGPRR